MLVEYLTQDRFPSHMNQEVSLLNVKTDVGRLLPEGLETDVYFNYINLTSKVQEIGRPSLNIYF